jgi:hypothetical protein
MSKARNAKTDFMIHPPKNRPRYHAASPSPLSLSLYYDLGRRREGGRKGRKIKI